MGGCGLMGSPKARKQEGYGAFIPGGLPENYCPYLDVGRRQDWMKGWDAAAKAYLKDVEKDQAKAAEANEEKQKWNDIACGCPWNDNWMCRATQDGCDMETCAPYHFIKVFVHES